MSFQLTCPNCGKRSVSEFVCKGELSDRPSPSADFDAWSDYVYLKANLKGTQREWWYHRSGCQTWFVVERDTTDNTAHIAYRSH